MTGLCTEFKPEFHGFLVIWSSSIRNKAHDISDAQIDTTYGVAKYWNRYSCHVRRRFSKAFPAPVKAHFG